MRRASSRRTRPVRSRTAWAALAGLVGGLAVGVSLAGPASADEVFLRPADGVFAIEGHGWGHGHGLSQWGAQGAASLGVSAETIVSTYYPNTARAVLGNTAMRVLLQAADRRQTAVFAAPGLRVSDVATGNAMTLPGGAIQWRATVDHAGLHLSRLTAGGWSAFALQGRTTFTGPLRFAGPAAGSLVRLAFPDGSARDYRGAVEAVATSPSTVATVDVLGMEDYLLGVVPRESSSSWRPAALQAQAIAARSYSAYKRAHAPGGAAWDICDSTQCQVFGGTTLYDSGGGVTSLEASSTTAAVRATAGVVRTYQGSPIFAEFSSSNGGWSTDGGQPYLVPRQDDWDGAVPNSVHSWTANLPVADLESAFPALGHLLRLTVTRRDGNGEWGGRVRQVVLSGVDGAGNLTSVTTSGAGIYWARTWPGTADGLRSTWWHIRPSTGAGVVSHSAVPALVLPPGRSTGQVTATLRNTGTTSWPVSGLHLAVASPPGQADPLVGGDTRPGHFVRDRTHPGAASVQPGDVVDFSFALDAVAVGPGLHGRAYRLRVGDGPLFGDALSWQVRVNPPLFRAAPVSAAGLTVVVGRRRTTTVRVRVRNVGNVTWPAGPGSPVVLATSGPRNRSSDVAGPRWVGPATAVRLSGGPVPPGSVGAFDLPVSGGTGPLGADPQTFEPLWQGRHWLDGAPLTVTVLRVDPSVSRAALAEQLPPATLSLTDAPAAPTSLVIRLRNVGGAAWPVGQERLAVGPTWGLSTQGWTSPTQPPALALDVTRPGAAAVAPGDIGEWRVPLSAVRHAPGHFPLILRAAGPAGHYGPLVSVSVTVTKAIFSGTLVAVSPPVQLGRTGQATGWYDVRNTGTVAWPAGGDVRSVALTPGGSPSRAPGWLSRSRPGTVAGPGPVLPGQVARFLLLLAGNGRSSGDYHEAFGMVWEGFASSPLRVDLTIHLR